MKYITLCIGLFIQGLAPAQTNVPDSSIAPDPNYGMDRYHDILKLHDPIMYIAFPVIQPIKERVTGLEQGEGKRGYWLESNFSHRFSIYKGKYYSSSFLQRMRLTLDASLSGRLTRDDSNPLLPFNNKFGLGLDLLFSNPAYLEKPRTTLVWTTIQLHHYSNGQADSFFIKGPLHRNNYLSGDFSTNYTRVVLNIGKLATQASTFIASVGYHRELDLGGPLSRSDELNNFYGDSKLLFSLHWAQRPKPRNSYYTNLSSKGREKIAVERQRQTNFRTELEYITSNLDDFPGKRKFRLGWHNYLTYTPSVTNEVGFMAHSFIGRDYLNMRFDDIVFIGELGLYLKFGR